VNLQVKHTHANDKDEVALPSSSSLCPGK